MQNAGFKKLITLGESNVAGASATKREYSWAELVRSYINRFQDDPVEFKNMGIGADIVSKDCPIFPVIYENQRPIAIERYRKHVIEEQPDLVIIAYGYNDLRSGTPIESFMRDYDIIVRDIVKETDATVVLCTTYHMPSEGYADEEGGTHVGKGWNRGTPEIHKLYNEVIRMTASRYNAVLADVYAAMNMCDWIMCGPDDIAHANDLGHFIIANRIFEAIATNCRNIGEKARREREEAGKSPWRYDSNSKEDQLIRQIYPSYSKIHPPAKR